MYVGKQDLCISVHTLLLYRQTVRTVPATEEDTALQLGDVKPADSGSYSCHVSNSIGSDSVDYTLEVYCE